MQDKHFMTRKNKELIKANKELAEELSLHKSTVSAQSQLDVQNRNQQTALLQLKEQLSSS